MWVRNLLDFTCPHTNWERLLIVMFFFSTLVSNLNIVHPLTPPVNSSFQDNWNVPLRFTSCVFTWHHFPLVLYCTYSIPNKDEKKYFTYIHKYDNMHTTYRVKPELDNWRCVEFIESCDPGQTMHSHTGYSFWHRTKTFVMERQASLCILTALWVE